MRGASFILLLLACTGVRSAGAQGWGSVEGRISEVGSNDPLAGVSVVVDGTNFGTASQHDGRFALRIPEGSYVLRFSTIGYAARVDSVVVRRGAVSRLDVELRPMTVELEGVTVEASPTSVEPGVYDITPDEVRNIPSPFKGYQALASLPGVATNNELSNQYSVRGGGFNENLIFINGFEVYMPFRPRQGEQEGLGLLNPDLANRITLYTGGFPARYGGKLASALEVQYGRQRAEPLTGAAAISLLDAQIAARGSTPNGRLGASVGIRKARAQHFFSTQELKGTYRPDYTDLQAVVAYRIAPGHDLEALGIWADHEFALDPRSRRTYFGIISLDPDVPSNLRSFWINFQGQERDGYHTRFGGVRLANRLSSAIRMENDFAYYETEEREQFDIRGSAVIFQVDPGSGNPETGAGHIRTGNAQQEEFADNDVDVRSWTGQGRWHLVLQDHAIEAGWFVRRLEFDDRLDEYTAIVGPDLEGDIVRIITDSLSDAASLSASQGGLYLQDALDVLSAANRLLVTAGFRADYFSFNDEWTLSPRLSARFVATDRLALSASWGVYYQTPTYRELRGKPEPGSTILGGLNRDVRSQRSIQYVAGAEYFIASRRLFARAEVYFKDLDRLISYDIENVRVLYSGQNDSRGRAFGLDVRFRGELVPGLESWLNYSYLNAAEDFLPEFETPFTEGLVPRPTDQRHTLSLFVQDYIAGDRTWKIHLRGLFGSGLPYTPPVPGQRIGIFVSQVPGERHSARYPEYKRIDAGVTKEIDFGPSSPFKIELTAELLNIFDMTNTVAFTWVPNGDGIWERIPTRLTPRTFNLRARVAF